MNLCDDGHDEICFEGRYCPFCEALETHKNETHKLENQIGEVEAERDDLISKIEELEKAE